MDGRNTRIADRPCHQFRQKGNCKWGAKCKFSHDPNVPKQNTRPAGQSQNRRHESGGGKQAEFQEWKQLLRQANRNPTRLLCDRFFELAVKLIEGDLGDCQETVKLLAGEEGLQYIRLLAERHIPGADTDASKIHVWAKQVRPLFNIITHELVVDSAVLEQQVATIYNFIKGVDSQRMRAIFRFVVGIVKSLPSALVSVMETETPVPVVVERCLAVLSKMMDCNTNNMVDSAFSAVVQDFVSILESVDSPAGDYFMLQSRKWLAYINRRLGVGENLPSHKPSATVSVGSRAQFTLPKNYPGHLSSSGRRHDNDHSNIGEIRILPTRDEIISSRGEYLPTVDPASFHHSGILGRLDREFRLLREDTVGQLRDAVRNLLEVIQRPGQNNQSMRRDRQGLFTYMYQDVELVGVSFTQRHGLELSVRFPQPRNITRQRRTEWWTHSRRLQPGALVCVISAQGSVLFCVVAETTMVSDDRKHSSKQSNDENTPQRAPSLSDDDTFSYAQLNFADFRDKSSVKHALRWYRNIGPSNQRCLVEFPGVLLASFQHTLEALQGMSKAPNVPFVDLIAPESPRVGLIEVPPPLYATKPGFFFDLGCLGKYGTELRFFPNRYLDPNTLAEHSTLDETQASALLNSLSRSLALVQGPPGTGKSYTGEKIIKVLLANKKRGNIGPILCVCYTNHALDQLLTSLVDDGVKQIVRIGSRSKSERLEAVNLRAVAKTVERTKPEKRQMWETSQAMANHERTMTKSLANLDQCLGRPALQDYLVVHHPGHHQALFGNQVDEEGFQEVRYRAHQLVDQWLKGRATSSAQALLTSRRIEDLMEAPLWGMTRGERHKLYNHWLKEIRDPIIEYVISDHKDYITTQSLRDNIRREVDLRCLSAADVIGVTTTGLARNIDLLRRLKSKVLLCEEAGEVLEAHNITALLPSIEHCILIGDHLQLRPHIQNYDLSSANPRGVEYSLDVSMFERLVKPPIDESQRLPFSTLDTQRRMHPSISGLIRQTLYPTLVDGANVAQYPEVHGMKKRLFWLHHEVLEDRAQQEDPTSNSHTNSFEVGMTVALVQHLVRQGTYGPDDIAVITPYLGQLQVLRREMQGMMQISVGERDLEELAALDASTVERQEGHHLPGATNTPVRTTLLKSVRLATVDNFQGEEAKVVVISLVRSNNENRCGFLNTPNRINVLLSRAKHGMYLISNSHTYGHVPMWNNVINILKEGGNIGPVLELQCPRHPDRPLLVSTPDHFGQFSPEGGCILQCDQRLSCGHACISRCHSQVLHNAVKCLEPCPRPKPGCEHLCRLPCGDQCLPKCNELLENRNLPLPCGHIVNSPLCWESQDPTAIRCRETVSKTVPGCNHTVNVPCYEDVTVSTYKCRSICGDPQLCGHSCRGECHRCKDREDDAVVREHHVVCKEPCNRKYNTCSHVCKKACHGEERCPPCPSPCQARCSHSKCGNLCHEPCVPCAEQECASSCPHQKCTMPCAAPCDWIPCSQRCGKILECGHQCPSLCGEACPNESYCQICCNEEIKSAVVDFIMGMSYNEVNLDEDPCIFPSCGHFITKSNMDGLMDLKSHYVMSSDDQSNPVALLNTSMPFSMDEVKSCPTCRGPLRDIARYGRIVRRAMLDEASKKFISWSHSEYLKLANELTDVQVKLGGEAPPPATKAALGEEKKGGKVNLLSNGRFQQLAKVGEWVGKPRYSDALGLRRRIQSFKDKVRKEEQPLQRVADHVLRAIKERPATGTFTFDESAIQMKGVLQASTLLLKCELVILTDFMATRKDLLTSRPELHLDLSEFMKECRQLVNMAEESKHRRQEAEGHIYLAQFCAFARTLTPEPKEGSTATETSTEVRDRLKAQGMAELEIARKLVTQFASLAPLSTEIDAVEKMLSDGVFYTTVSKDELSEVYKAMATEFGGTGHWYTCTNGHPFTIGECGMPMELARCPECAAPVGGQNHTAVAGVNRADDIEELGRDLNRLGI
ncbi:hypothetical protein F5Y17DRAFT_413210 [Xylariaceae sp. FL0594]|nr:hypothetical protein F5Y17DRAFT_413210 [Xylariaceae sp. FL0594]